MESDTWKHCTDSICFSCVVSADAYEVNAKSAFFSASERWKGEGKGLWMCRREFQS